nr:hypothetical protein [uncultured Cohaesibacter sp.]
MSEKQSKKPDWSAIRAECENKQRAPFSAIAAVHGISVATLRKRRKMWKGQKDMPQQRKPNQEGQGGPLGDALSIQQAPAQPEATIDHLAMVRRLYNATDQQIRHLERQLQDGSAAFDEKEARMLGTIARTLDRIMELNPTGSDSEGDTKQTSDGNDTSNDQGSLDRLREELARRLDGLKQGSSNEFSGRSEPQ